jgi:hypothetical protein
MGSPFLVIGFMNKLNLTIIYIQRDGAHRRWGCAVCREALTRAAWESVRSAFFGPFFVATKKGHFFLYAGSNPLPCSKMMINDDLELIAPLHRRPL